MAVMTVAQLRAALEEIPGETLVVLAKDSAGNSFSPLPDGGIEEGQYLAERSWSGIFYDGDDPDLDEELQGVGVRAVCLWPTN